MEKLVSVIVPSFNYQKYIIECLSSIFYQSYKNIELIIIDDFSSDDSCKFIEKYISGKEVFERFENIIFIKHTENKGAHFTINEGIEISKGEYVAVINSDDMYESNRFQEIIPKMVKNNSRIAFSKVKIIDEDTNLTYDEEAKYFIDVNSNTDNFKHISHSIILQNVAISTGNFVFKRDLYEELYGFREFKYIHDWDFILRASLLSEPLLIEVTNYMYRLHKTNSFRSLDNIANYEVDIVLTSFFEKITNGEFENCNLSLDSISYLIENYKYLSKYIINKRKKNKIFDRLLKMFRRTEY